MKKLFYAFFIAATFSTFQKSIATIDHCPARTITIHPVDEKSNDLVDQLMLKYSPYAWLSAQEQYKGLSFEEYVSNSETEVLYATNREDPNATREVVIPAGSVTMEKLACLLSTPALIKLCKRVELDKPESKNHWTGFDRNLYLSGPDCLIPGANPNTIYADPKGNVIAKDEENGTKRTPIYTFFSKTEAGRAYLQYYYFYGYNGAYGQHIPIPIISHIDVWSSGNHDKDLEHLTLEFDVMGNGTRMEDYTLRRIGFNSHGDEMKWMKADDTDLVFYDDEGKVSKEGTHPEAFLADKGHGFYPPPAGTWLRICGEANEICDRGQLWKGIVVRLERYNSPYFNPSTMGITAFPGYLGKDGVPGFLDKAYTGSAQNENGGLSKADFKKVHCEDGNWLWNEWCVGITRPYSCYIPDDFTAKIADGHKFAPNLLPPDSIRINRGTTLIFSKRSDNNLSLHYDNNVTILPQSLDITLLSLVPDPIDAVYIIETADEIHVTFNKTGIVSLTFFEDVNETYDEKEAQEDRNTRRNDTVKTLDSHAFKETSVHVQ